MDKNDSLHPFIRVDHAGELGAKWIYEGQLRWISDPATKTEIQHMYDQETAHLNYFEDLMKTHQVRPTILLPLWKWVGRTAGAISAALGPKAAMAVTEAVEDVIDSHYAEQIQHLETSHPQESALVETLKKFRDDECNHRDTAKSYEENPSLMKDLLKSSIKLGVRTAISLSKRI